MSNLKRITKFWDGYINNWLNGSNDRPDQLADWYKSYNGKASGTVAPEGMPEPWIGDLTSPDRARMVILGLNPGQYISHLQGRKSPNQAEGVYAAQVRKLGSYTKWAATNPYLLEPWKGKRDLAKNVYGTNRYHQVRQTFARRWLGDPTLPESAVIVLELYPWHSTRITGLMRPLHKTIKSFIWDLIDELVNVNDIFAFGKPWVSQLEQLELRPVKHLGSGGVDYCSSVKSRSVNVYKLAAGKRLIVEWHSGSAGPPSEKETFLLKQAIN